MTMMRGEPLLASFTSASVAPAVPVFSEGEWLNFANAAQGASLGRPINKEPVTRQVFNEGAISLLVNAVQIPRPLCTAVAYLLPPGMTNVRCIFHRVV